MTKDELDGLRRAHTREAIRLSLESGRSRSYLRDAVYGAADGVVTTLAIVVGARGAGLPPEIALVLGAANLLADGFSMAAGNFLGARAERQRRDGIEAEERRHIRLVPEGEREELRQIFAAKGFSGEDLERTVAVISADEERWVETMLREEFGLEREPVSPLKAAGVTLAAFVGAGAIPLSAYVLERLAPGSLSPYPWSVAAAGLAFFAIGALKGRVVGQAWPLAGLETFGVGATASALAFAVGKLLA